MKILLMNQFFWPDSAASSQLLTDLARELARRGHIVTAICSKATYASTGCDERPQVNIMPVPSLKFSRGPVARFASYASFFLNALCKGARIDPPDVVLTLTTPPLLSCIGTAFKLILGCRHFIWEMDVYPDVAVDLGVLARRSLITRVVAAIADSSRKRADGIFVLGGCMRDRLMEHGIPFNKMYVAENWADGRLFEPDEPCGGRGLAILYSGNLGMAHDIATIESAMLQLRNDTRFRFAFAGGGSGRKALELFCREKDLGNVTFLPYRNRADLGSGLAEGDIGLVTQKPECLGDLVPSKLYGIMAAGRPVLFIGPKAATPSRIIAQFGCGWQIDCGDDAGLLFLLLHLAENTIEVRQAGRNARQAFLENYDLEQGVSRIASVVCEKQGANLELEAPGESLVSNRVSPT
jgi:colanic acid biosynthesis glycosyl transferase WcaI